MHITIGEEIKRIDFIVHITGILEQKKYFQCAFCSCKFWFALGFWGVKQFWYYIFIHRPIKG